MARPPADSPVRRVTTWAAAALLALTLAAVAAAAPAAASPSTIFAHGEPLIEAIAVGLVISLAFSETLGLSAGGMIVPGYVALALAGPPLVAGRTVAVTLAVSLATFAVIRVLSRYMLIYGRRRTVIILLVAFTLGALARAIHFQVDDKTSIALVPIGFIVPGLIADWMERQGLAETVSSLVMSSVIVRFLLIALGGGWAL